MRRLPPLYKALLALLGPLWLAAFAFQLRVLATDSVGAWPTVVVSAAATPDGYPTVAGFQTWESPPPDLAVGDRVLKVGAVDLRGAGPVRFTSLVRAEAGASLAVPLEYERGSQLRHTTLHLRANPIGPVLPFLALLYAVMGVLLLVRAPRSREAHAAFQVCIAVSVFLLMFHGAGSPASTVVWLAVESLNFAAAPIIWLHWVTVTPDEVAPAGTGIPGWAWPLCVLGVTLPSSLIGWPLPLALGSRLHFALGGLLSIAAFVVFLRNYQRASPVGRRTIKWILYGGSVAAFLNLFGSLIGLFDPGPWFHYFEVSWLAFALPPICTFIAVTRYDAFDIDRVITSTVSTGTIGALLIIGFLVGTPALGQALGQALGANVSVTQAIASLVLAACAFPAQRVLHTRFERLFFAEHVRLQEGVHQLLEEVTRCANEAELIVIAGTRLDALFKPERCAIYARSGQLFECRVERGAPGPAAFEIDSPVVDALTGRNAPFATVRDTRSGDRMDANDRAVLEALDAEVVAPVQGAGQLAAFLCLGAKRTGDVYTPTDLTLLTALAQTASGALVRIASTEQARQSRAAEARMRRYVPDAVADRVASGRELKAEQREVSVLFVDIRGYTSLCEGAAPEEIFSAINRYTETVAACVRQHAGTIVDFSGDGVMAVFGAPEPLPSKERAAVETARDIVAAVGAISLGSSGVPLSVGVGVATGEAYVGNVRAADRLIWTALGNAINLAARLQVLTRDLGAAIVIDGETRRGADPTAADFLLHPGVTIRGRAQAEDVYSLPLVASSGTTGSPGMRAAKG